MVRYKRKNITETDIRNIVNLYELKKDINYVSSITGINKKVVKRYLVMKYDTDIPLTDEEINDFRDLYNKGKSLTDISQITGRPVSVIRKYIKDLISNNNREDKLKRVKTILKSKINMNPDQIFDIYMNTGFDIKDIAKYYEAPIDVIETIIKTYVDKYISFDSVFEKPYTKGKIKVFKDFYCNIGDKYHLNFYKNSSYVSEDEAKSKDIIIKKKSTNTVITENESFQYKDIILYGKKIE